MVLTVCVSLGDNPTLIYNLSTFEVDCITYDSYPSASSRLGVLGSLPSSITLGAQAPFTTTFGSPKLYVYDKERNVVAQATASSVDGGGSTATFPFPTGLTQDSYSLAVANVGNDGQIVPASVNVLSIASSQTISGSPFGVAAQYISSRWTSWDNDDPYGDWTCAGQWVINSGSDATPVPVVSLYSLNSVKIGTTTIPVGSNPTAVTVYAQQDFPNNYNDGPCHSYQSESSQFTRAIVANSGSNTVSILDLMNNAVVSEITVGSHPVALAVASDSSAAYVANYGDGTVTKVNLNTNTPSTTIAVGGAPTSVTLTAAGILWVGGVGFLTEINTQNMGVVATQSTGGKTIAALAFSNGQNELIATTTDNSGTVNIDEVNPNNVLPGTPYSALASHTVSTTGMYFNPRIQAMVHGFTGTVSQSFTPLDTNQAGAQPLVVQDDWAVVSATPTGFTITDISGHNVLVSQTTASPIAAIAIDHNLHIAYLSMPDSNTLLTVPLPGVD